MSREAFEAIMAGIEDAGAYLRGDTSRGRAHKVKIEAVDVAKIRRRLELTQEEFASVFCVKPGTIRNWEQRRRVPEGPALVLLNVIANHPNVVLDAVQTGPGRFAAKAQTTKRKRGRPTKKRAMKKAKAS